MAITTINRKERIENISKQIKSKFLKDATISDVEKVQWQKVITTLDRKASSVYVKPSDKVDILNKEHLKPLESFVLGAESIYPKLSYSISFTVYPKFENIYKK